MEEGGNIKQHSKGLDIEWTIPNFKLSKKIDECYYSPHFSLLNKSWCLWIYPNGRSASNSNGFVHLYLVNPSKTPCESFKVTLGLKSVIGKENRKMVDAKFFPDYTFSAYRYMSTSELLQRKSELMPSNALTVLCTLKPDSDENQSEIATSKCCHCKEFVDAEDISAHEKMCVDKPIKGSECSNLVTLKSSYDDKCQVKKAKAIEKLLGDLKDVMMSGDHSDIIIRVKEEEFRLHRNILGARNPYFDSMFKSDMKEKKTGIVTINDCDPNIFRSFIHFVYTGEVDKLSSENVCDLFRVADKYQENQLKEGCLQFMINSIAVENFCDFILVALKYDEKELLENATKFFASKTKEIICNVKWLTFLQEYPVYANELHIKALDRHQSSL